MRQTSNEVVTPPITLSQAFTEFMADCNGKNLTRKTLRAYNDVLHQWIQVVGKDKDVKELTVSDIRNYVASLQTRPGHQEDTSFSTHSVAKYYAVIRTFVRWLFAEELVPSILTVNFKGPKVSHDLPDPLNDEELGRLSRSVQQRCFRDRVIVEFFLDTGVRLEELSGLTLDRINLEGFTATVIGKGRKTRQVPLGPQLSRDLRYYIDRYRHPAHPAEPILFLQEKGEHVGHSMGYEGMSSLIRRILEPIRTSGKCGPHTLRHTFATLYLRNRGSLEGLRRILGHTDVKVTQRYIHLVNADVQEDHRTASPLAHLNF